MLLEPHLSALLWQLATSWRPPAQPRCGPRLWNTKRVNRPRRSLVTSRARLPRAESCGRRRRGRPWKMSPRTAAMNLSQVCQGSQVRCLARPLFRCVRTESRGLPWMLTARRHPHRNRQPCRPRLSLYRRRSSRCPPPSYCLWYSYFFNNFFIY